MSRRRRWAVVLAAIGVAAGLCLGRTVWLPWLSGWLDVGEPPRPADYVIVLGGGANQRPFVAAALVRVGLAQRVLVTRGAIAPDNDEGIVPPEHELSRAVLLQRGVPAADVAFLGAVNYGTRDEAVATAALLDAAPTARVLVVTSGYHTRRTRWIFGNVLGDQVAQITFVSAPVDEFSMKTWWHNEAGFSTIASENLKLGYYLLRYSRTAQALVGLGMLLLVGWVYARRRHHRLDKAATPNTMEDSTGQ